VIQLKLHFFADLEVLILKPSAEFEAVDSPSVSSGL